MKTAREILHKYTADETAIDYLRDIIVECMEEYANQKIKGTPTAKEYYTEKNNGKPPDESTADGELITPLYAVRLMEEYGKQQYKQGWDDRVKEAMKLVRTRPVKRL